MKEGPRTQTFKLGFVSWYDLKPIELCAISRGVHGSGWVELRGFFDPTHHGESKKIQPNPTQLTWVKLGQVEPMGLTIFYLLLLNLVEKKYKY